MSADTEISFDKFESLPVQEQERIAGSIYAGEDHPIFAGIKQAFLDVYPQSKAARVFVGGANVHGYIPAVNVTPEPGTRITGLPTSFLGLPVIRNRRQAKRNG